MNSKCRRSFWSRYQSLPEEAQRLADKTFELWKANPSHPSLHFKAVGDGIWSVRIGIHYRALGERRGDRMVWFWIGHHTKYDYLI